MEITLESKLGVDEYDKSAIGWSEWPNLPQPEKQAISKCNDGCVGVGSEAEGSKMSNARAEYVPDDSDEPKTWRTGPPNPMPNKDGYLKK